MSFQRRVTLASAAAVAIAVVIASSVTYVVVRNALHHRVNNSLSTLATAFVHADHALSKRPAGASQPLFATASGVPYRYAELLRRFPNRPGDTTNVVQMVTGSGKIYSAFNEQSLPLSKHTLQTLAALARSGRGTTSLDATAHGEPVRLLVAGVHPGFAVVVAHPLAEVNSTLKELRLILLVLTLGGIALAALLGWFVARMTLAPVRHLTATVRHITETQDLGERIDERRRDELGSLARSFNSMVSVLDRTMHQLDESARVQRRLVADASHELRTPVTSIRTNIEILERADELPADERTRLVRDVVIQLEELSELINDLIELAREDEHIDSREEIRFDVLVSEAIDRARLHSPRANFDVALDPTVVTGVPSRLGRAVNNLLDNAVKFAGTEQPIEVRLHGGELEVRDHGPGIDAEDLPHIFDRFFRGARSRALPGSGLGLAIVRQVAELHAGSVSVAAAPGGGTVFRMRVPITT
ncbi:MAG TPA: HAMP domain-containing sensor histidine kinase [Solirubrobacteraceae bacterium]|jgi:two-component system sensor histidine kinase MprB